MFLIYSLLKFKIFFGNDKTFDNYYLLKSKELFSLLIYSKLYSSPLVDRKILRVLFIVVNWKKVFSNIFQFYKQFINRKNCKNLKNRIFFNLFFINFNSLFLKITFLMKIYSIYL